MISSDIVWLGNVQTIMGKFPVPHAFKFLCINEINNVVLKHSLLI